MSPLLASVLSDPKGWATALVVLVGTPITLTLGWLWRQYDTQRQKIETCELERALLAHRITELEGSVNTLTELLRKEVNIG